MEHKFVESENDERRHCAYCGFYEDYAALHCPARAEETKLIEAAPILYSACLSAFGFMCQNDQCQSLPNMAESVKKQLISALGKAEGKEG